MPTESAWISITVYSHKYGVHRKTVHKWLEAGLLDYYRVQRLIRVENRLPKEAPIREARPHGH